LGAKDENLTFLVNWTIALKPEPWTNKLTQTLNHHLNPKTNSSKLSVYQGLTKWWYRTLCQLHLHNCKAISTQIQILGVKFVWHQFGQNEKQ
jgi:hypothetical protein